MDESTSQHSGTQRATRRTAIAAVAGGVMSVACPVHAQDATPVPSAETTSDGTPVPVVSRDVAGEFPARVHFELPSTYIAAYMRWGDLLVDALPAVRSLEGFTALVTAAEPNVEHRRFVWMGFWADAEAKAAGVGAMSAYEAAADPRIMGTEARDIDGMLRVFHVTTRTRDQMLPSMYPAICMVRERVTAPGTDIEAVIQRLRSGLVPLLAQMPGFIAYLWVLTDAGRVAMTIWDTPLEAAAGEIVVANWVSSNTASTLSGDPGVTELQVWWADFPTVW